MQKIISLGMTGVLSLFFLGCGMLTDKDRKIVAEFNGKEIRRVDLRKLLRDMDDEERPIIQTHADLLRTLNKHIDTLVKAEAAEILREEGKIEVARDEGQKLFFRKNPDFLDIHTIEDAEKMGFTKGQLAVMKAQVEFGIDDEVELLYQEAALAFRINEWAASGTADISDEAFAAEYERKKESYKTFEYIDFIALRIPNQKGAQQEAIKARKRIVDGESFDAVLDSYMRLNQQFGMRSAFENNPSKALFFQFWYNVTGCKKGDVLGPLFLPAHDQIRQDANGQAQTIKAPASWVVLQVEEHRDPVQKNLEEAKEDMFMSILSAQMMQRLRDEFNVVVYADQLWRPEGIGDQYKDSMIDVPQKL